MFLQPGDDGGELLFSELSDEGISAEFSFAEGGVDELADQIEGI
jgi:hypothetical protein